MQQESLIGIIDGIVSARDKHKTLLVCLPTTSEVEKRSFYNIYEFPYFLYMILEIEIY